MNPRLFRLTITAVVAAFAAVAIGASSAFAAVDFAGGAMEYQD